MGEIFSLKGGDQYGKRGTGGGCQSQLLHYQGPKVNNAKIRRRKWGRRGTGGG